MNGALARTRPAFPASTVKAPRCTIQKNPTHLCAPRKMQKPSPLKSRNGLWPKGVRGVREAPRGGRHDRPPARTVFLGFSGLVRVCLRQMEKGRPAYRTGTTEIALVHFENEFTHGPRVQFFFSFTRRYQCPATTLKARTSTPTTTTPSARTRAAGRPSKATTHL